MTVTVQREMDRLERWMIFLASVGSTAPFIGLFGTVWGIMLAFSQIGAEGSTALAVVAPGIAEALMTTAGGLFAAVPAVYFYNHFTNQVKEFATGHFPDESVVIVGDVKKFGDELKKRFPDAEIIPLAQLDLDSPTLRKP